VTLDDEKNEMKYSLSNTYTRRTVTSARPG